MGRSTKRDNLFLIRLLPLERRLVERAATIAREKASTWARRIIVEAAEKVIRKAKETA